MFQITTAHELVAKAKQIADGATVRVTMTAAPGLTVTFPTVVHWQGEDMVVTNQKGQQVALYSPDYNNFYHHGFRALVLAA